MASIRSSKSGATEPARRSPFAHGESSDAPPSSPIPRNHEVGAFRHRTQGPVQVGSRTLMSVNSGHRKVSSIGLVRRGVVAWGPLERKYNADPTLA